MRRRIFWLTAATTSAVVLSFVVPLCLLVRAIAEDRAMAEAEQESRNVAVLVSGLGTDPQIGRLVAAVDQRSAAATSVVTPDGQVLGRPPPTAAGPVARADLRRARAGEAFTARDARGARILVPIVTGDGTFVVRTEVPRAVLHRGVTRAWVSIAALGLVLLGLALLIATRLGRRVSTPVTELAEVAHRLREGDLDARAVPRGGQETVELGVALNRLAERIRELLEAERASVGDLSHRLRTPVTALRLDADAVHDPELADRLLTHVGQLQRTIDAVVRDARRPVREDMGSRCDATAVIRDRVTFWSALAEDQERELTVRLPAGPRPVALAASDLSDIVDVLVDNVFAHTPEGTPFAITVDTDEAMVVVSVTDRGPGAPVDGRPSADRVGFSGLGLQIVRRTLAAVGGELRITGAPGRGMDVHVLLPRSVGVTQGRAAAQSS